MTTAAVIPIKQLKNAKQRLAGLLNPEERMLLFRAMVEDVLTAVEACLSIDRLIVVTDDEEVAELAMGYGAEVMPEPNQPGLIEAVTEAGEKLAGENVNTMVFLPGDIPLVTADELEVVLEGFGRSEDREFLIVPATDLGGSNCVAVSPPDCMKFAFGVDSFRKHVAIAKELGIEPAVAKLPGIGLDVDTPEDMADLLAAIEREPRESHTIHYIGVSGIASKLENDIADIG